MKAFCLLCLALFSFATAQADVTLTSSATSGKLEFLAIGKPSMIRIKGEGPAPQGTVSIKDKKATGEFKIALQSLTTGIDMRDSHMKEKYLEVQKNPDAILKISDLEVNDLKAGKDLPFKGTLLLHGVEKPVSGTYTHEGTETSQKVKAAFNVLLTDHTIEIPSYAGIKVADKVEVKIELELKK